MPSKLRNIICTIFMCLSVSSSKFATIHHHFIYFMYGTVSLHLGSAFLLGLSTYIIELVAFTAIVTCFFFHKLGTVYVGENSHRSFYSYFVFSLSFIICFDVSNSLHSSLAFCNHCTLIL